MRDAFGIVAPRAVQWASFKEYGRPDARAILGGQPLRMQDDRLVFPETWLAYILRV
jgi:hypothetical protein